MSLYCDDFYPLLIKPEDLENTFAVIVPNMNEPWNLMNHCQKWMKVLTESIFKITGKL